MQYKLTYLLICDSEDPTRNVLINSTVCKKLLIIRASGVALLSWFCRTDCSLLLLLLCTLGKTNEWMKKPYLLRSLPVRVTWRLVDINGYCMVSVWISRLVTMDSTEIKQKHCTGRTSQRYT